MRPPSPAFNGLGAALGVALMLDRLVEKNMKDGMSSRTQTVMRQPVMVSYARRMQRSVGWLIVFGGMSILIGSLCASVLTA